MIKDGVLKRSVSYTESSHCPKVSEINNGHAL